MFIKKSLTFLLATASLSCLQATGSLSSSIELDGKEPNFTEIKNTDEKKQAFIDFFYPRILKANLEILEQRSRLKKYQDPDSVADLCQQYRVDCSQAGYREQLLDKINIILPSIALAQGAVESQWGQSRFAEEGDNFFGVWCYQSGCGIVPSQRPQGETYEVKAYDKPYDSVKSYMALLNRHAAYAPLREARNKYSSPYEWTQGLSKYSGLGDQYGEILNDIILYNDLVQYDQKMFLAFKEKGALGALK